MGDLIGEGVPESQIWYQIGMYVPDRVMGYQIGRSGYQIGDAVPVGPTPSGPPMLPSAPSSPIWLG